MVLGAAFFSAAETALVSVNQYRLRHSDMDPRAHVLEQLMAQPQWLMTTLFLGKTLFVTALVVSVTAWLNPILYGNWIAFAVLALVLLVFAEVLPKSLIAPHVESFAIRFANLLRFFTWLFKPVVALVLIVTKPFVRLFGGHEAIAVPSITEEDLSAMIERGEQEGVFEKEETDLVQSALAFDDTPVSAVLTPRVDIVAIPEDCSVQDALQTIAEQGYSRIPVYRENIDDIIGILYAKDLLIALSRSEAFELRFWLRPAYFVPHNKRLNDLLREMQSQEIQMAIVNDEYGGTAGLVTVEDILEQIVGEIRDEYDEEPIAIRLLDESSALVNSRTSIDQVNETLGTELPIDGYQTMGGLVISHLGRVAKMGDVVEAAGARITVKAIKGVRIQQVLVEFTLPKVEEEIS